MKRRTEEKEMPIGSSKPKHGVKKRRHNNKACESGVMKQSRFWMDYGTAPPPFPWDAMSDEHFQGLRLVLVPPKYTHQLFISIQPSYGNSETRGSQVALL